MDLSGGSRGAPCLALGPLHQDLSCRVRLWASAHSSQHQAAPDASGSGCSDVPFSPSALRGPGPTTLPSPKLERARPAQSSTPLSPGCQDESRGPPEGHTSPADSGTASMKGTLWVLGWEEPSAQRGSCGARLTLSQLDMLSCPARLEEMPWAPGPTHRADICPGPLSGGPQGQGCHCVPSAPVGLHMGV